MSYAERRRRKDKRGLTAEQMRKRYPEVYGQRGHGKSSAYPFDQLSHYQVIEQRADGTWETIAEGTVQR